METADRIASATSRRQRTDLTDANRVSRQDRLRAEIDRQDAQRRANEARMDALGRATVRASGSKRSLRPGRVTKRSGGRG